MYDISGRPDGGQAGLLAFVVGDPAIGWVDSSEDQRKEAVLRCLERFFGPDARENVVGYYDRRWPLEPWVRGCPVDVTQVSLGHALANAFSSVYPFEDFLAIVFRGTLLAPTATCFGSLIGERIGDGPLSPRHTHVHTHPSPYYSPGSSAILATLCGPPTDSTTLRAQVCACVRAALCAHSCAANACARACVGVHMCTAVLALAELLTLPLWTRNLTQRRLRYGAGTWTVLCVLPSARQTRSWLPSVPGSESTAHICTSCRCICNFFSFASRGS